MKHPYSRRGMALLMVLLLLSLTLGLCYAAMRSQYTSSAIQRNFDRRAAARQAALTGLTMALKKMHRGDWGGVDSSLSASLSTYENFLATYTAGDATLDATDPDQPYRVTLLSTGYAVDAENPQSIATYRLRAVVRFIPRKLADEPADWETMMGYTVYQRTFGGFTINVPARIEGQVYIQATLGLDWDYPWWGRPRDTYHSDLEKMRRAGRGDYRPFNARVSLPSLWQLWDTIGTLRGRLRVPTANASIRTVSGLNFPGTLSTYQLYPGGKQYTIPQLPRTIEAVVYRPDPATNPAGLYFRTGALDVGDDVTIQGTVITAAGSGGRIYVSGKRVRFEPVALPPLLGTTEPVQLPVVMVGESFRVGPNADVNLTGLIAAYYSFQVDSDNYADVTMSHQGKLIAQSIHFNGRTDWYKSSSWWSSQYEAFHAQERQKDGIKYFPEWLWKHQGLNPSPQLIIKPDTNPVRYHWHNPQNTIYVAHPDDDGLRWELLSWEENV